MWTEIFKCFTLFLVLKTCETASWNDFLSIDLSGTLNLVLSAPHGGTIKNFSPTAPDREHGCYINGECVFQHNCGVPDSSHCRVVTVSDYKTDVLTHQLRQEIYNLKHAYPKTVINNVHRSKLDPNRPVAEATFGETIPTIVYNWYHGNITAGIMSFGGAPGLVVDVHGYSTSDSAVNWTLLGYTISGTSLNTLTDVQLDAKWNDSSIRHLAASEAPGKTFSCLLRGACSFGSYMEAEGLEATPAPKVPQPGSEKYYSGGYTTKTYGLVTDTIQAEIHRSNRTPKTSRDAFAKKFAKAIVNFYDRYFVPQAGLGSVIGYTISGTSLNTLTDVQLDAKWNDSSIRHLAASEAPGKTFSCLLRGACSFGSYMEAEGLEATPAPKVPQPGSEKYYSGGYTTKTYGLVTDTIQAEIHRSNRTPKTSRDAFAKKFAKAIVNFYDRYFVPQAGLGSVIG